MVEQINFPEQLNLLVQLQEIDAQIYKLNAEKEAKPEEISNLKDSLAQKESGLKEAEKNLKNLQVKRKEKEIDLETKEVSVKKLQIQLYQLKSNKEYQAMQHEIEVQRADNSILEEEIINLMIAIDAAETKVKEEKNRLEEDKRDANAQIKMIEDRIKKIDATLSELKAGRDQLTPLVNQRILKDYERILVGKDGLALVEVVNDACGGCYMNLPPQVINEIKMKEDVVFCESCRRMLYIKDEQT